MAARHRARPHAMQIMKVQPLAAKDCKRASTTQFHVRFYLIVRAHYIWYKFYYISEFSYDFFAVGENQVPAAAPHEPVSA